MTRRRRDVLLFIMERQARGEAIIIGQMVRVCKLVDRSSAKRIMKELRDYGLLPGE